MLWLQTRHIRAVEGQRTKGLRHHQISMSSRLINLCIVRDFPGDTMDSRSWLHWCILWINECHRVLKPEGYFLMFSDWRQLPTASDAVQMGNLIWRGIVAWNKGNGSRAPHKGYFRHQCEYIVWGTKGKCPRAQHAGPYPGCFDFPVKQSDL